jgi:hypothetical protein
MDGAAPTRGRDDAAERYRQAAQDALEQLDWCIGYFHGTGRVKVSGALSRNRSYIRSQLLPQPAEPLPEPTSRSSRPSAGRKDRGSVNGRPRRGRGRA